VEILVSLCWWRWSSGDPVGNGGFDAALVMASADATGRTKREKIIKANPFLEGFTIADLRNWADRKMRVPRL
jgi:hypothetical protein